MDLTDEQWAVLEPLIPEPPRRPDGRGRPWKPARDVLNGILWILRTGAPWKDMPDRYPPYQTCHRRFQRWEKEGVMDQILLSLAQDLKERGDLDISLPSWDPRRAGSPMVTDELYLEPAPPTDVVEAL